MSDLKQRFLQACNAWCDGNSYHEFWRNWRGTGDGSDDEPCVALVQYARSVGCSSDPDLVSQLDRILHVGDADHLSRAASYLPVDYFPVELRVQLSHLVRGIAYVITAAIAHRSKSSEAMARSSLQQAARHYFAAWRMNLEDHGSEKALHFQPAAGMFSDANPAAEFVMQALGEFEDDRASQSTKLILRRLLSVLWDEAADPFVYQNDVKMLLVDAGLTGHVAPTHLELRAEQFHGVYPDPLAFGVTVIDRNMQQSFSLAWKCAWQSLKSEHRDNATAVRIVPEFPAQTPGLGGGSAGALMACALYATAKRERIDARRTATAAIRIKKREVKDAIQAANGNHLLSPDDIVLSPVKGIPAKVIGATEFTAKQQSLDQIVEIILCDRQAIRWNAHPQAASSPLRILGAVTLGDLLRKLQADEIHERLLEGACDANRREVNGLRQANPQADINTRRRQDEHRLDCYVWPRYSTEQIHAAPRDAKDVQQVERVPVPGEGVHALNRLLQDLLASQKNLVIHDDAGAGKTVFSYQCLDALSRHLNDTDCLFERRWPLVVRWHGRWPSDGTKMLRLRDALAAAIVAQLKAHKRQDISNDAALAAVDYALQQRRVVIIIDGFDQCDPAHRTHLAGLLNSDTTHDDLAALDAHDASCCHWIFTGRGYAIQNNRSRLFDDRLWTFARIERFNQTQWEAYFRNADSEQAPLAERWRDMVPDPEAVSDLLELPLVLREIRRIAEDLMELHGPQTPLPVYWTAGELHEHAAMTLLQRALNQKSIEADGARLHKLCEVISLLAFQLMLESTDYNGTVAGTNEHPQAVQQFEVRARRRWLAANHISQQAAERDEQQAKHVAEYDDALTTLKKIELSHRAVMDVFNHECLSFRSTKTMEWYAARYLTHHASQDDVFASGQPSAVDFINVAEWSNCWQLAIDMPPQSWNRKITARSLSALFHEPRSGTRPTELMFLAWPLFEYDRLLVRQLPFVVPDATGRLTRKPGQTLVEEALMTEQQLDEQGRLRVLPDAKDYVKQFRKTSDRLAAELKRRTCSDPPKRIYCKPSAGVVGTLRWLVACDWLFGTPWQRAPSRVKSHTMLQCPAQGLIGRLGEAACIGWMGSADDESDYSDERPRHRVRVTPFHLQATSVTRGMYRQFDGRFESTHSQSRSSPSQNATGEAASADLYPVIATSWFDAWVFCKWLGPQYRLPAECEWEHACRAGTETAYHFGSMLNGTQANCDGSYPYPTTTNGNPTPKGTYLERTSIAGASCYSRNAYGLFDMHGNVREWCWDWRDSSWYATRVNREGLPVADPNDVHECDNGPASGSSRVLRGGSWRLDAGRCRSAVRNYDTPGSRSFNAGFRLVCE